MYTYEQRLKVIDTYLMYHGNATATIRDLGYPRSRTTLHKWIKEYINTSTINIKTSRKKRYTEEQVINAVNTYVACGMNYTKTISILGYPSKPLLRMWVEENIPDHKTFPTRGRNLISYSYDEKIEALKEFLSRDVCAAEVAAEYSTSAQSLYNWKKRLLPKEGANTMRSQLQDNSSKNKLNDEIKALQDEIYRLRIEKDALEQATHILKKEQGINLPKMPNKDKAVIIDTLRSKYCLKDLLELFQMAKSSFFYQLSVIKKEDKYQKVREQISIEYYNSFETYGYRRIKVMLQRRGTTLSEKVIRRLMKEDGLIVKRIRLKKYNSYKGEITPAVPNIIQRNFHAQKPNEKWLTDITEFKIPAGKVYLSPVIDCFDGMPVSWAIGTSPNEELVSSMLDDAIETLSPDEKPIVHSDRGCHYRWQSWIDKINNAKLVRSMSRKGCSPDNAACEAFFGRIKNEFFYNRSWTNVTINQFMNLLDSYLIWYSRTRIKITLGGLSPLEYRQSLGIVS